MFCQEGSGACQHPNLSMYLPCLQQTLYIIGAGKKSQGKTLKWHNF